MSGKTLAEISDMIMRQPAGGVITDENKLDTDFIDAIVDNFASAEKRLDYQKNRTVDGSWLQTYIPSFDSLIQSTGDCLVQFECPAVIHFGGERDGFEYVGTYQDNTNKATLTKVRNFPYLGTGGMPSVYSQHRITNNVANSWTWLNDTGGFQLIKIYGNKALKNLMIQAVFASPSQVPGYRREYDMYPISEELLSSMMLKIFKEQTQPMYARPADIISNNQDNANLAGK